MKIMNLTRHYMVDGASVALRKTAFVLPLGLLAFSASPASADSCSSLDKPIYQVINPTNGANLLTPRNDEATQAKTSGFTQSNGTPFYASVDVAKAKSDGLVPAYRMYRTDNSANGGPPGDFIWIINPAEVESAKAFGYVVQDATPVYVSPFYVSPSPRPCTQPVYRFRNWKTSVHRFAVGQADLDFLRDPANGWESEGVMFHAGVGPTVFSMAIMPDTQNEVSFQSVVQNNLFGNRTDYLVTNKDALNLRFVLHSGDVSNWGENDDTQKFSDGKTQFQRASDAMRSVEAAGIPYVLSFGNHDTKAVCPGGAGCQNANPDAGLRQSPEFNKYFANRFGNPTSPYLEKRYVSYCTAAASVPQSNPLCNISNGYTLFEAGGLNWMVLSLELWPRTQVLNWAKDVIGRHKNYNVIVVTHSYLGSDGNVLAGFNDGPYGTPGKVDEHSPKELFDTVISKYSNVRFVFSGHAGMAASGVQTGDSGNRIASYLECFHAQTNPVRILQIDATGNTATSYVYAPLAKQYWNGSSFISGTPTTAGVQDIKANLNFIR